MRLIVRDGVRFTAIGLAIGLVMAAALGRVLRVLLYQVSPIDAASYGSVCLLFGAVAIAACYFPARRAGQLDPVGALKSE